MNHYRCLECYFLRIRETRYYDIVEFIPNKIQFPEVKLRYFLIQAATDIITILTQPKKKSIPTLEEGNSIRNALLQIAEQLKRVEKLPEPIQHEVNMNEYQALRVEKIPSQKTIQQSTLHLIPDDESTTEYQYSPLRVEENKIPVTTLLNHSTLPKNI